MVGPTVPEFQSPEVQYSMGDLKNPSNTNWHIYLSAPGCKCRQATFPIAPIILSIGHSFSYVGNWIPINTYSIISVHYIIQIYQLYHRALTLILTRSRNLQQILFLLISSVISNTCRVEWGSTRERATCMESARRVAARHGPLKMLFMLQFQASPHVGFDFIGRPTPLFYLNLIYLLLLLYLCHRNKKKKSRRWSSTTLDPVAQIDLWIWRTSRSQPIWPTASRW